MPKNLTNFEKKVYDFIKTREEILTTNMPSQMSGAIPNLKNQGLIEVYKKSTSRWTSKKMKFIRPKEAKDKEVLGDPKEENV